MTLTAGGVCGRHTEHAVRDAVFRLARDGGQSLKQTPTWPYFPCHDDTLIRTATRRPEQSRGAKALTGQGAVSVSMPRISCTTQVTNDTQDGQAVPLGREPLCPMFSWVKAKTHYDILVPDGTSKVLKDQTMSWSAHHGFASAQPTACIAQPFVQSQL